MFGMMIFFDQWTGSYRKHKVAMLLISGLQFFILLIRYFTF